MNNSNFRFPKKYKNQLTSKDTIKYINFFYSFLKNELIQSFNLIEVFSPVVSKNINSLNCFTDLYRFIEFDNKFTNDLITIYSNPGLWLKLKLNDYKIDNDEGLLLLQNNISRDAKMDRLDSIISQKIYIEHKTQCNNFSIEDLKKIFLKTIEVITNASKKNFIKELDNSLSWNNKPFFLTTQELENNSKYIGIKKGLERIIKSKKSIVLLQTPKLLISGEIFSQGLPLIENYNLTGEWYCYDDVTKTSLFIMKISCRPNGTMAYDQTISTMPYVLDEKIYNKNFILNLKSESIGIEINFSNLILLNCKKAHLCEVTSSLWNDELIEYCKNKKIDIL